MIVQLSSVAEIEAAPNWLALADEYAAEAQVEGMPPPNARWETYRMLEGAGILKVYAANVGDVLAGFISVLASNLPQYGETMAVSESFFVAKKYRRTGAGLRLLAAAEQCARDVGAPGILVSAPCHGALFVVLPRKGYVEYGRIFFKKTPALEVKE